MRSLSRHRALKGLYFRPTLLYTLINYYYRDFASISGLLPRADNTSSAAPLPPATYHFTRHLFRMPSNFCLLLILLARASARGCRARALRACAIGRRRKRHIYMGACADILCSITPPPPRRIGAINYFGFAALMPHRPPAQTCH